MRSQPDAEGRYSLPAIGGFACNQGFVFSLFYMGANQAFGAYPLSFERAELFGTLLFMIVSFALLRALSAKARDALLAQPLQWCYAGLLVVGSLIPTFAYGAETAGLVVGSALIGLPAALMLAAWGRALGARPMRHSVSEVFLGSALGALVCFVFAAAPIEYAPLALKLLPLGSAGALYALSRRAETREEPPLQRDGGEEEEPRPAPGGEAPLLSLRAMLVSASDREATAQLSLKMMAGAMLYGLAAGFMETYRSDPGMASTPTFLASLLLFVVFCIAALQLIATGGIDPVLASGADATTIEGRVDDSRRQAESEGPLDGAYRLSILVMMAGFLFVPVLGDFGVPGEAIVLAGYLGLSAVLISLFLVMAHITGQDAARSFARGFMALFAGEMAGIGLGNLIDFLGATGNFSYVVVACAGLAALYAFLFLFTERDFRSLSSIARDAGVLDETCLFITRKYGLSRREAEILPFALKGRTGERIAAEFFIAKSTVDTHLRRIYTKTDVHGRQELIDLGERTATELTQRRLRT